jgi:hypothetical protein
MGGYLNSMRVTPFMMVLSTITIFFLRPGVVALGIGSGRGGFRHPDAFIPLFRGTRRQTLDSALIFAYDTPFDA